MSKIILVCMLCSVLVNVPMERNPDSDVELGDPTSIPKSVSREFGLTREDIKALQEAADKRWTRRKTLTALTLVGTAASVATTLFLHFYGDSAC